MTIKKVISPSKECAMDERDFNVRHFSAEMADMLDEDPEMLHSNYSELKKDDQLIVFEAFYECMSEEFRIESIVKCEGLSLMSRVLFEAGTDDMNDAADVLREELFKYLSICVAEQYEQYIEYFRLVTRTH